MFPNFLVTSFTRVSSKIFATPVEWLTTSSPTEKALGPQGRALNDLQLNDSLDNSNKQAAQRPALNDYLAYLANETQKEKSVTEKNELTEIQRLKAENFKLKVQLTQCQATVNDRENKLSSFELTKEQNELVNEFRKTLGALDSEIFDWSCLCFKPPSDNK